MSKIEEVRTAMYAAMKAKDKDRLTVIRMLKAALDKERIDKKIEITDEVFISVLEKQVKMRNDSIEEFKKAGREELVEKTLGELEVLKKYLPEALSEDEVMGIINDAITKLEATTMKDMGKVMSEVSPKVKGRYDMKEVSSIIKSKLS